MEPGEGLIEAAESEERGVAPVVDRCEVGVELEASESETCAFAQQLRCIAVAEHIRALDAKRLRALLSEPNEPLSDPARRFARNEPDPLDPTPDA